MELLSPESEELIDGACILAIGGYCCGLLRVSSSGYFMLCPKGRYPTSWNIVPGLSPVCIRGKRVSFQPQPRLSQSHCAMPELVLVPLEYDCVSEVHGEKEVLTAFCSPSAIVFRNTP